MEKISFKERLVGTNKDKIVRALVLTAIVAVTVSLFFVLMGNITLTFVTNDGTDVYYQIIDAPFYKIIFGGFFATKYLSNASRSIPVFSASPILLPAFILAIVGLILIVLIAFNYKNKLLNKTAFTLLCVIAIVAFVASGVLFCFKDFSISNQVLPVITESMPEGYSCNLVFGVDPVSMITIIAQFVAASSLFAGLLVERKRLY